MGLCTSRGVGKYVAAEVHNLVWSRPTRPGAKLCVNAQGSHSLADSLLVGDTLDRVKAVTDAGFVVIGGDLSQTASQGTFGNDTSQTRVGQLRTFAQGTSSSIVANSGKLCGIGGSGGCTALLNYARANPTLVSCLYLIVPLVDVEDFYSNWLAGGANGASGSSGVTQTEINKAYNGGVDDGGTAYAAAMASHNPYRSGNQAALAGVPIRLAYSTNDPFIPVAKVTGYRDLVNAAGGTATAYSQGAVGHAGTGVDPQDVALFFSQYA